ncbi:MULTISPECIES: DUF3429 domain-containing protein [unclassified Janthinobacterium]|jgi:hypothetical protein|uniref:DUF3429 domain-containing protein n=1 Tax=unclassified Janthinobacterium TaxID=2610881 RepID=UPI0018CB430E|nr:DUF3429 domain-containing protein [Janthinobacterium sp. CG_23.4]MDH6158765.1 hypothetical protein [Janthinobacterium sp. CG_23.4]
MSPARTPRIVACLAYAGLIPFLALLAATWLDTPRSGIWQHLSLQYGAVILSFVGALHWGFAMSTQFISDRKRNVCYAWSVIPALLAWLALALDPLAGSALLATGFGVHYLQDWRLFRHAGLPAWYLPMRLQLSIVAAASLLGTSFAGHLRSML